MLSNFGNILVHVPYWLVDQIPLFLFILASLFIFRVRSKKAVIFLITLSAVIAFYLSYVITTACWADMKCALSSQQEVCRINSYCKAGEESWIAIGWSFLKAFVLWVVAIKIFYFKSKFMRTKNS